jgi:drug/metabolite transporter (DMT)-like permease
MKGFSGGQIVSVVAMLALLFLMGRRLPGRRWPVVIAATLAVVVLVVLAEQNGLWPRSWHVQ